MTPRQAKIAPAHEPPTLVGGYPKHERRSACWHSVWHRLIAGANFAATLSAAMIVVVAVCCVLAHAQEPAKTLRPAETPTTQAAVRFAAVDVYVDSGEKPLAAYQFELTAKTGSFKIVGVEGGEHAAFAPPPYYDPAALSRDRIIIAAFNTGTDLPTGKTRVARIHVRITGNEDPEYVVKLTVAAAANGEPLSATAAWAKAPAEKE
jgi:hypothetical protein